MTKEKRIAEAFISVAEINNYMVGFTHAATKDELEKAKQILIVWANKEDDHNETIERALDLIEQEIKGVSI